jgi:hypothetical protein
MTSGVNVSAWERGSDGWDPGVGEGERGEWIPFRVLSGVGRGLDLGVGRMASPRPFIHFLIFFSLFYSPEFYFNFYLFKFASNQIQTTFQNILIFNTMF